MQRISEFQEFTDTKELIKKIKHCKTRWLSPEKVLRVLQQWCALHAYLDHVSESDQSSRGMQLNQHLKSPLTKLVLLFLEFALD